MIEAQLQREPSRQNIELLEDLNEFRSSFTALFSGLSGYVTTRNSTDPYIHTEYSFWGGLEGPGYPLGAPSRPPQRWGFGGGEAAPEPPPNMPNQ